MKGNAGQSFVLNGTLDPYSGGITINQLGTGLIDLDGDLGNGFIQMGSQGDQLTINGTQLNDSFNGTIVMLGSGLLDMNLSNGWTAAPGSLLSMIAAPIGETGSLEITGGDFTLQGHLSTFATDTRVTANTTFNPGALVTVGGLLRFFEDATINGGEFDFYTNGNLDFLGATTISGGSFATVSQDVADGVVDFSGTTTWQGTVTIDGVVRQNGAATVAAATVINGGVFDLDGFSEGSSEWNVDGPLTLNVERIDSAANNRFDGEMTVTGSALNRLTVNLANPAAAWQMGGVLNLTGNNLLFFDRVFGSEMAVTGVLNISNSRVGILADVAFGGSAVVNFGGGSSQLRLRGDTLIAPGATFNGDGLLVNGNGGRMTIADGNNLGDAGLRNDALLVIDEEAGTILVDRFENGSNGTLQIEIGGLLGGDYDSVSTTLGSAVLDGQLQVLLINAGLGMFLPQVGDDFTILTAVGGVSGTFASPPADTNVGGIRYEWEVDYNPTTVVLELADIAGLLGDYNGNGVVDAADYAVWRDSLGENTFLAADGNQNGVVDPGDYGVWMANFGNSLLSVPQGAAVPEPSSLALIALAAAGWLSWHRRR